MKHYYLPSFDKVVTKNELLAMWREYEKELSFKRWRFEASQAFELNSIGRAMRKGYIVNQNEVTEE